MLNVKIEKVQKRNFLDLIENKQKPRRGFMFNE